MDGDCQRAVGLRVGGARDGQDGTSGEKGEHVAPDDAQYASFPPRQCPDRVD
jgi:hypothetical protein